LRNPFKGLFERRAYNEDLVDTAEALIRSLVSTDALTAEQAMSIPGVKSCVNFIAETVASLPIKLYKEENNEVTEVKNDERVRLLNDETGDTLDAFQMKKAFVQDLLLNGAGYIYINRERNRVKSLHYVDYNSVSVQKNTNPIFKMVNMRVQGEPYYDWQFIKATASTKDGASGKGIVAENKELLLVAYQTLLFEMYLLKYGGNKKGFLQAAKKLAPEAMDALKAAWNNLYANNQNNMMVLNEGITFKESSNTSVEMQLNENKKTNTEGLASIFNVSPKVVTGEANADEYASSFKTGIQPKLTAIQTAMNKALLLETEKQGYYFAFDTTEQLKGDILKRYQAYEVALRANFLQLDEVRYKEDMKPYGFKYIKLGLQDVLLNPETKEIYTPNTNKTTDLKNPSTSLEGGDKTEN
jgi:HK97 family phage portal protein